MKTIIFLLLCSSTTSYSLDLITTYNTCEGSTGCGEGFVVINETTCSCTPGICLSNSTVCPEKSECTQGDRYDDFTCNCWAGFGGMNCEQEYCSTLNACNQNGLCAQNEAGPQSYNCTCDQTSGNYWFGNECEIPGTCQSQPDICNNGDCMQISPTSDGYVCECFDGYSGTDCDVFNECNKNEPCSGNGDCTNETELEPGWKCDCIEDWDGDICSNSVQGDCATKPCANGICQSLEESFTCICMDGYIGSNCSEKDPCGIDGRNGKCSSHGNCTSSNPSSGDYSCQCDDTWSGNACDVQEYCETEKACNSQPCKQGSQPDTFNCNCSDIYMGTTCDIMTCNQEVLLYDDDVTVTFAPTLEGDSASSDVTCDGGTFDGKPVGTMKCLLGGTWEDPIFINCSKPLEELESEEKAQTIEVITSDPNAINSSDVTTYVEQLTNISSEANTTKETADSLTATVNNLIESDSVGAEVQHQSSEILESLDALANNVELAEDGSGTCTYSTVEGQLSMTVLENCDTKLFRATPEWSYSINKVLYQQDGFAGVDFFYNNSIFNEAVATNYISLKSDGRITMQSFFDSTLFPSTSDDQINSILYSAGSTSSISNLKFQFQLFKRYNLNENGSDGNVTATCMKWNPSNFTWNKGCSNTSIESDSQRNYVKCNQCTSSNQIPADGASEVYTVLMIPDDKAGGGNEGGGNEGGGNEGGGHEGGGGGLSAGAIAGIAVGSVAAVGIVAGGAGYAVSKNKKKKSHVSKLTPEGSEQRLDMEKLSDEGAETPKEAW